MLKSILVLFALSFSLQAFAQLFTYDLEQNVATEMPGRTYAFFSHATSYWDRSKVSYEGTRRLYDFAKRKQISTLVSVHEIATLKVSTALEYYVQDAEADQVLHSEAGQHLLSFPNAESIYFAGGNLTLCLCEAIRDVARGSQKNREINLIVVTDAVYDYNMDVKTPESALYYVEKYIVPHFRCPDQNWMHFPELKLSDAMLEVSFAGKVLQKFDLEPNDANALESLARKINLKFVDSTAL